MIYFMQPLPQKFVKSQVYFLGEQDGPPEQALKARLITFFKYRVDLRRAYLARIAYGTKSETAIALCVRKDNDDKAHFAEEIRVIFGSLFSSDMHLDIVFLNELKERALMKVCLPFYSAPNSA